MHNYRELRVWQKAMRLAYYIYTFTQSFPDEERFGLTSQIRRSAVSIPSNIAEGSGRKTNKEFTHFLHIALGSANELSTQLEIGYLLNYLKKEEFEEILDQCDHTSKMLRNLMKSLD